MPTTRWIGSERISLVPGADAAEAGWFPAKKVSSLWPSIMRVSLEYAHQRLRNKMEYTSVGFHLLPPKFTLSELQTVYEAILGKKLDKRNFRRRISNLGILKPLREWQRVGRKPAQLISIRSERVKKLLTFSEALKRRRDCFSIPIRHPGNSFLPLGASNRLKIEGACLRLKSR